MALQPQICPISGDEMTPAFQARLLGRHDVAYALCPGCGLLQTEPPYWLEEAYSTAIAKTDLGLVQRNNHVFRRVAPLLYRLHGPNARVLDTAGGYGMLARLFRDWGLEAYTGDEHCKNLLCGPFEAQADTPMDAICAIEVMEHLPDPVAFLQAAIDRHTPETVVFSTVTYPGPTPPPPDWWYYSTETGQHITFFQPRSIQAMASRLNFTYTRLGGDLHLFTRQPLRGLDRAASQKGLVARLLARRARRAMRGRSRLGTDYEIARQAARADRDNGEKA